MGKKELLGKKTKEKSNKQKKSKSSKTKKVLGDHPAPKEHIK